MAQLTSADRTELGKYERSLVRREFIAKHAGVLTGLVFAILGAGIGYLLFF